MELIGYYSYYSNLTGECTFSAGCNENELNNQFNAGKVDVYGLEAAFEQGVSLPFDIELSLKLLYTLTLSRFRTSFTSSNPQFGKVDTGDELPYIPKHQGTILTRLVWRWAALDISASYIGTMRNTAGQGDIPDVDLVKAHVVFDLAASFEVITNGHAYMTIKNLFNSALICCRGALWELGRDVLFRLSGGSNTALKSERYTRFQPMEECEGCL